MFLRRREREWGRKNNDQEFSKINDGHQTKDPRSLENAQQS